MINTYRRIPADPAEWFAPEEVKKAKDYQRPQTVARLISLALNLALLLGVIFTHAAPRIADPIAGDAWVMRLIVVAVFFSVVFLVVDLPISIWTTFSHEKKWGFSTETPRGFVVDQIKNLVLGLVIQIPLFLGLWWLIRTTDLWWLFGWIGFFAFSVVLAFLYPIVIAPIFNKFTPLDNDDLVGRLRALAERNGMRVKGVQVMDASKRTRKDNAYFAGVGKTRQIVVFDNLLNQSVPVVESVVGHELGHWRRRHHIKGAALGTVTSFLMFLALRYVAGSATVLRWAGVTSLRDPASMPIVIAVFVGVSAFTSILQAWLSRAFERQADLDALEITGDYDAFVETEHGLSTRNLIDLAPSTWRYVRLSHPPPAERLELGKRWNNNKTRAS